MGSLRKYRGISVNVLGQAMAKNIFKEGEAKSYLTITIFPVTTSVPAKSV